MSEWDRLEAVDGKFPVPVPRSVESGDYQLLLSILDMKTGVNLVPEENAREINGLLWLDLDRRVEIRPFEEAKQNAMDDRNRSLALAEEGSCEDSWTAWKDSTRHIYRNRGWKQEHDSEHRSAVARCHFELAKQEQDEVVRIEQLLESRKWDHRIDGLAEYIAPLAEELDLRGQELYALEDWDGAYDSFSTAVALEPFRSKTRLRTEEARDKRLKITPPYKKKPKPSKKPMKPFKQELK